MFCNTGKSNTAVFESDTNVTHHHSVAAHSEALGNYIMRMMQI